MKHIAESIIGKRGSGPIISDIGIMQGDIVYFRRTPDMPYMAIIEESLYNQIMRPESLTMYDLSKGVFLFLDPREKYGPNFMLVSDYDKSLKYHGDHDWDIAEVRRGYLNRISPSDMTRLISINNLKELAKNFKPAFKNGKWL